MHFFIRLSLAIFALALSTATLRAELRQWSDSSGKFKIDAELIEVDDAGVHLRQADGKTMTVPLNRLSEADQAFVRNSATSPAPAPPLGAVVRIVAPITAANGEPQEIQLVGCAISTGDNSPPIVITSRLLTGLGMESGFADAGLAKAEILDLRTPKQLGAARTLGFPAPQGGVIEGLHDFVIVLPTAEGAQMPTLPLADEDPQPGAVVLVPLLPRPQREQSAANSRPPIKWTKWSVVSSDRSRIYIEPEDGQFPWTGAVPIVNEKRQLVGLYVSHIVVGEERRHRGDGPTLSAIRAALKKSQGAGPQTSAPPSASAKFEIPKFPPIPAGPIDKSAAWRTSYEALVDAIKTKKDETGKWEFDWGDATDFGAWYERCRFISTMRSQAMQNRGQGAQIFRALTPIEAERDRAVDRLQGVEWTAVAKQISASPSASSRFDLPGSPEPLAISFWVDEADAQNWAQVRSGDRVRYSCRFEDNAFGDDPLIFVRMTLIEVIKP